jgi:hypothetical protein
MNDEIQSVEQGDASVPGRDAPPFSAAWPRTVDEPGQLIREQVPYCKTKHGHAWFEWLNMAYGRGEFLARSWPGFNDA